MELSENERKKLEIFKNSQDMSSYLKTMMNTVSRMAETLNEMAEIIQVYRSVIEYAEDILSYPIESLKLSGRATKALKRLNCVTIKDALNTSPERIRFLPEVGKMTRLDIFNGVPGYRVKWNI